MVKVSAQLTPEQQSFGISREAAALMDFTTFCQMMTNLAEGTLTLEPADQSQVARVQNFRPISDDLQRRMRARARRRTAGFRCH